MIGFNRDITDRKLAEQEVLRLNQDLERRVVERTLQLERAATELEKRNREVERVNRMKSEFLARSSHELRTPLNAIVGYSDLLSEQSAGPLPPPYPRFVANIQEGARHLLDMVNDLLDISRIEAGRIELTSRDSTFPRRWTKSCRVITPLAEIKSIRVENRVAPGTAVMADRVRFKQILYNLMSNAVKFTPEEGRVWIETAIDGEMFTVCVGDTGIGIAPGEQEAIFEEFHQVASARRISAGGYRAGPGDHPQTGSPSRRRRSCRKPAGKRQPVPGVAAVWGRTGRVGNNGGPCRKVLVVDDNRPSRELIVDILRPLSLEVAEAPDGTTALAAARSMRAGSRDSRSYRCPAWTVLRFSTNCGTTRFVPPRR